MPEDGDELTTAHELLRALAELQRRAEARAEQILLEESRRYSGRHVRREGTAKEAAK